MRRRPISIRYAERLWPGVKAASTWTHGWNSRLAITPDTYPCVAGGESPDLARRYGAASPLTTIGAQLARRLVGGRNAEIDMPVTGIKPMPLHAFWPVGVTAAVLAGRVRDRLGM